MDNVDKNYNWYKKNLENLLKLYRNKYIIISDEKVIFVSEKKNDVVKFAKNLELGNFIIQECVEEDESNIRILNRVSFGEGCSK